MVVLAIFTVESLSDICQVCYWQHDFYQEKVWMMTGGPNTISLRDAKINFMKFGAVEKDYIEYVRKLFEEEMIK